MPFDPTQPFELVEAPATNAAPRLERYAPSTAEPMMDYIARSPIVQDIGRGARMVGREALRDIGAGWNSATWPARYAASEVNRTVIQPLRETASYALGDIGRGVSAVERGAGRFAGQLASYANENVVRPAANWFNSRVVPPELQGAPPNPAMRKDGQVYYTPAGPKRWQNGVWWDP